MSADFLFVVANIGVLIISMISVAVSLKKRELLTSADAWDRLMKHSHLLRGIFLLFFISLSVYLIAESAELVSLSIPSDSLEYIHELGETIHMIIAFVAIIMVIPLFKAMLSDKDDS